MSTLLAPALTCFIVCCPFTGICRLALEYLACPLQAATALAPNLPLIWLPGTTTRKTCKNAHCLTYKEKQTNDDSRAPLGMHRRRRKVTWHRPPIWGFSLTEALDLSLTQRLLFTTWRESTGLQKLACLIRRYIVASRSILPIPTKTLIANFGLSTILLRVVPVSWNSKS